ncbi:MAG: hypothetical protein HYZ58_16910, partial [Acidobacteria bacterium]|nr:hypothetical protein [Acidobacteriota bacterium]
ASICVYVGAAVAALGLLTIVWPIRWIRIGTRRRASVVFVLGAALGAIGFAVPARERRVDLRRTELDQYVPVWQFAEWHSIEISAPPARVYRALKEVTAEEITLFRTLTWIRRFGRPGPESVLNAPEKQPLLDVALKGGFKLLADDPAREILVVTLVAVPRDYARPPTREEFRTLSQPGYAKAAMNFVIEPTGDGRTRVVTETRVFATDAVTARRFKRYWRLIYPGSAIIRVMWLRAVKRRAESRVASDL